MPITAPIVRATRRPAHFIATILSQETDPAPLMEKSQRVGLPFNLERPTDDPLLAENDEEPLLELSQ